MRDASSPGRSQSRARARTFAGACVDAALGALGCRWSRRRKAKYPGRSAVDLLARVSCCPCAIRFHAAHATNPKQELPSRLARRNSETTAARANPQVQSHRTTRPASRGPLLRPAPQSHCADSFRGLLCSSLATNKSSFPPLLTVSETSPTSTPMISATLGPSQASLATLFRLGDFWFWIGLLQRRLIFAKERLDARELGLYGITQLGMRGVVV